MTHTIRYTFPCACLCLAVLTACPMQQDEVFDWMKILDSLPLAGIVTVESVEQCEPSECYNSKSSSTKTAVDREHLSWENRCLGESSEKITSVVESGYSDTMQAGKRYAVSLTGWEILDVCVDREPSLVYYSRNYAELKDDDTLVGPRNRTITLDEFLRRCEDAKTKQMDAGMYPLGSGTLGSCGIDAGGEDGG